MTKSILHLLFIILCITPFKNAVANPDAVNMIENLHSILSINMQQADTLGYQGRYDNLSPLIDDYFDFPLIAEVILSRHWKTINQQQQKDFIEQLRELTKTTYAARFNEYIDEKFITIKTEELKKGRLLIKTEIQSAEEETVSLNYLVHPDNGDWKIISVIANGVNDLSLKRAEYSTIIREQGFDHLQQQIAIKIKEQENF